MKVRFWGTRGSIPVSITATDIRAKLIAALIASRDRAFHHRDDIEAFIDGLGFDVAGTFGGHSSCVQLMTEHPEHVILDMGSGARPLGQAMLDRFGPSTPQTYHVFMSHLHWDHIMGFPFFAPVYIPGNRVVIHSCHREVELAFRRQQDEPSFPVRFDQLAAEIRFEIHAPDSDITVAGLTARARLQQHSGDSYGWSFSANGKRVIYATDSEHDVGNAQQRSEVIEFFRRADLVIFDAMYSLADSVSVKADWGHSSNVIGVELCQAAQVRQLMLFHHEPAHDDTRIAGILAETRRYEEISREDQPLEVFAAYDGLVHAL